MHGSRGDTIQRGGYIDHGTNSKPREYEMRNYNEEPNTIGRYYENKQMTERQPEYAKEEESCAGYCVHLVIYLVGMGLFVGAWAIDYYRVGKQASRYYQNSYSVLPYIDITAYSSSTAIFTTTQHNDAAGVTMALLYAWVFWKGPLMAFALHLTYRQEGQALRFGSWAALFIILLATDILLTIFGLSFYGDWTFFTFYTILTVIVVLINYNGIGKTKQALANSLIPLLLIIFLYCTYTLFLPSIYYSYTKNQTAMTAAFLVIYLYPLFDLALYSLTLFLGTKVEDYIKNFFSMIHFLLIGYGIGMVLNTGYTEVEFYYLLAYFIFRNVFVNYIMRRWQKVVSNPPALPCWGVSYYLGYALSFIPVVGIGKIVVARSFSSYIFALTPPLLYSTSNPLYASSSGPTGSLASNWNFQGKMFWLAGLLIWIAMTFTQRYDRKYPKVYDFFYYLFGIQLFYLGIASSISVYTLAINGHL